MKIKLRVENYINNEDMVGSDRHPILNNTHRRGV